MTCASPNTPDAEPDYADLAVVSAPPPSGAGPVPAAADDVSEHRRSECVPNVPDSRPRLAAAPPPRPARDGEEEPAAGGAAFLRLRLGYWAVGLAALSLFGIMVFGQAIAALSLAQALPGWARFLLLVPLGACLIVVLALAAGFVASWLRLRLAAQIDLAALRELDRRAETRRDGLRSLRAARISLENYLAAYPLDGDGARRLREAGCSGALLEEFARERVQLAGRKCDSLSWLDEFQVRFQDRVDQAARERIRSWSVKAGLCAMASPLPLLDAALVLGVCLRMLRDVSVLYNVRCGGLGTLALLNRAIFAAFVAGTAGLAGEAAADSLSGLAVDAGLGGVAGKIGVKLGEGAVNALFVRRLGQAAMNLLRPLRPR